MPDKEIYNKDNQEFQYQFSDLKDFNKRFVYPVAENLYHDYTCSPEAHPSPEEVKKDFKELSKTEQSFWIDYATEIPSKFKLLNLFLHHFEDFCRTCIITDTEIRSLAQTDLKILLKHKWLQKSVTDSQKFFKVLNYLIPAELKKSGYEIIRHEEVSEISVIMIRKLARAIHSRYMHEVDSQSLRGGDYLFYNPAQKYTSDFDELPDEIKFSNFDNAAHIPTKLLSIGYKMRQVTKGFKPFALHLNRDEIETMARVEHIRWSWEKRLTGWSFGKERNEILKTHPSLIPYEELNESEKQKDRELIKLIPAFLHDIDYEAFPISPSRIKKLSYAIKPQSSIHKILDETRELNSQIRKLVTLAPEIDEMVQIRNRKIEEAINEVEGSYNYAQHIQETFLPDDLYIRECFTDSFVLFKPKDIVSGDFYFFSKRDNFIIFAAVDCTGHGIPGALLSTLGYGILDQAVNEIKLTDPSHILHHLYTKIHRYLRNDSDGTGITDDMDIILCCLDTRTYSLAYSAVKNPLYCIINGDLTEYPPQNSPVENCDNGGCEFISTRISIKISDTIYLCSDGFSDQFGGKRHKKYQRSRLKTFLKSLKECSMTEQCDRLYEELEQWRDENNEDQTDDILILGIRI